MTTHLLIYLSGKPAGELRREGRALSFCYESGYLSRSDALPLSRHLPLQKSPFADSPSRAFFANLLPEGEIRTQIARQLGVSTGNIFAMLEAIGGDCAGAVSLHPPGVMPGNSRDYQEISDEDMCSRLADLPSHPLLSGEEGVRLSLAGAQNKLPIYWDGHCYYVPRGSSPSSHILKTPVPQLADTVINEAFCMNLAQLSGIPVPRAEVAAINGRQFYRVERYDRRKLPDGTLVRLHQEDFCQALGVPPELKYEAEGGPGIKDCFRLAVEWSDEPALDCLLLLRWNLFNFMIGNADAHAKNLSFIYSDGKIRLAPFYDLLSTTVYPRLSSKFAMRVGGQKDSRYLMTQHAARFAADAGIALRVVRKEWNILMQRMEAGIAQLTAEYDDKFARPAIIADICRIVSQRSAKGKAVL